MDLPDMFAFYLYCAGMGIAWIILWFADICKLLDGTSCNDTEALTIRICSFIFLYLASLPYLLVRTNKDDPVFLKQLALHMMYGVGVMIGGLVTLTPSGVEPKWYHFADLVSLFVLFAMLYIFTSDDLSSVGMYQSPFEGHGANPRTFLVILGFIILVKVLTVPDFMPLTVIVKDPDSVTVRAEIFYSFAFCEALALLFLLAVPIQYGNATDQLYSTVLIVIVQFVFGMAMLWRFAGLISAKWAAMTTVGLFLYCGLALVALIGAYQDIKRGKYDPIPSDGMVV
jgi:hypothetical protein